MKFLESDIDFEFGTACLVKKFDEHRYYNILSGSGLKGVDFIVLVECRQVVLIEAKNYKKRSFSPVPPDVSDLMGRPIPLADHFASKLKDSLTLISVVNKFFRKKWWYWLYMKCWTLFPLAQQVKTDMGFWLRVHEILQDSKKGGSDSFDGPESNQALLALLVIDFEDAYEAFENFESEIFKEHLRLDLKQAIPEINARLAFPEKGRFRM